MYVVTSQCLRCGTLPRLMIQCLTLPLLAPHIHMDGCTAMYKAQWTSQGSWSSSPVNRAYPCTLSDYHLMVPLRIHSSFHIPASTGNPQERPCSPGWPARELQDATVMSPHIGHTTDGLETWKPPPVLWYCQDRSANVSLLRELARFCLGHNRYTLSRPVRQCCLGSRCSVSPLLTYPLPSEAARL